MRIDEGPAAREIIPWSPIPSRALVPVQREVVPIGNAASAPPAGAPLQTLSPLRALLQNPDADVRALSPRQMSEVSMDLYAGGAISWDEYSALAFQPELHPDYNRTIGALIGDVAQPDRPQDFVAKWEDRHAFETRYNVDDPEAVARTGRVVDVLHALAGTTPDVMA